jgi:hypothetical protein
MFSEKKLNLIDFEIDRYFVMKFAVRRGLLIDLINRLSDN